jgi:hypothetical protein
MYFNTYYVNSIYTVKQAEAYTSAFMPLIDLPYKRCKSASLEKPQNTCTPKLE